MGAVLVDLCRGKIDQRPKFDGWNTSWPKLRGFEMAPSFWVRAIGRVTTKWPAKDASICLIIGDGRQLRNSILLYCWVPESMLGRFNVYKNTVFFLRFLGIPPWKHVKIQNQEGYRPLACVEEASPASAAAEPSMTAVKSGEVKADPAVSTAAAAAPRDPAEAPLPPLAEVLVPAASSANVEVASWKRKPLPQGCSVASTMVRKHPPPPCLTSRMCVSSKNLDLQKLSETLRRPV